MGMFGASNLDRLREFIKHVFVKKVFMGTGSRRPEKVLPFVEDPLDKYVPRLPISEPPQNNKTKADDGSTLGQVKLLNMMCRMILPFGASERPTTIV